MIHLKNISVCLTCLIECNRKCKHRVGVEMCKTDATIKYFIHYVIIRISRLCAISLELPFWDIECNREGWRLANALSESLWHLLYARTFWLKRKNASRFKVSKLQSWKCPSHFSTIINKLINNKFFYQSEITSKYLRLFERAVSLEKKNTIIMHHKPPIVKVKT